MIRIPLPTAPVALTLATLALVAAPLTRAHAITCSSNQPLLGAARFNAVETAPAFLTQGDFDHDGILDLAVAISHLTAGVGPGEVRILHGVGDGTFTNGALAPAGTCPLGIAVGDFNHDGIADLAVTNYGTNNIAILIGNGSGGIGNGTFGAPVPYVCGNNPHQIVAADFNADGILDLAVSLNGPSSAGGQAVAILLGHGTAGAADGTFGAPLKLALLSSPVGVCVGDFDGDGHVDVAATEAAARSVAVFRGIGDGTFQSAIQLTGGAEPYGVTAADVDHDGHVDLLVANSSSGGSVLLRGFGGGAFASPVTFATGNTGSVRVADVNGDGVSDLVTTETNTGQVQIWLGDGGTVFHSALVVASGAYSVYSTLGDFNGDGLLDVAVHNYTANTVAVLPGACSAIEPKPRIVAVRDVPNDQGGKVFVTWQRSGFDVAGGSVTSYRVWRRIPAALQAEGATRLARDPESVRITRPDGARIVYWEAAAVLPAQRLDGYGYTAATAQDSIAGSDPYTAFFITAATASPDVFYDSAPDSGHSIDNLAPAPPSALAAQYFGTPVQLSWHANTESDLASYALYRGNSPGFVPGPANLVYAGGALAFTDPTGALSTYKLIAIDVHGNRSATASVSPSTPTAAEIARASGVWTSDGVALEWIVVTGEIASAEIQRADAASWRTIGEALPDGSGRIVWRDDSLTPGSSASYRLAWHSAAGLRTGGEVAVNAEALRLAFHGAQPNPAMGARAALSFSLPSAGRAMLAVFDMAGRRVASREVGGSAGRSSVALRELGLRAGVYLARITQDGVSVQGRFVTLP